MALTSAVMQERLVEDIVLAFLALETFDSTIDNDLPNGAYLSL